MNKSVHLTWHGPFTPLESDSQDQIDFQHHLKHLGPTVYASVYPLKNNKYSIYFGYSENVHNRILDHCRMTLAGHYIIPCEGYKNTEHQITNYETLTRTNIEANREILENEVYYFAEITYSSPNKNTKHIHQKELASDIERALILGFEQIHEHKDSSYFSHNNGLQGCRAVEHKNLEITMHGTGTVTDAFKEYTIIYGGNRDNTKTKKIF